MNTLGPAAKEPVMGRKRITQMVFIDDFTCVGRRCDWHDDRSYRESPAFAREKG